MLANAALATIRRLSPSGMGLPPYLCLSLARSLLTPILLYGSTVWNPPPSIMGPMSVFWHRVCTWITNSFFATNLTCLHREACVPPLLILVRHQRRLAGLRLICSPPEINTPTARLPKSVPTFSQHRATLIARGKITSQRYLFCNLDWRSAPDKLKNPRYRHNAITAFANAATLVHDVTTLPPISLHLTEYLPPVPGVVPSYACLKLMAKQLLLSDWSATPAPPYYAYPPSTRPYPFMGLGKFVAGRIHQMRSGKSYLAAHPSWGILLPTHAGLYALRHRRPSSMPSGPALPPPFREPASSKGSQTWLLRPRSALTSSCSLPWLSSSAPPPPVSLLGCPHLLPPSTSPQTPSCPLPPCPPWPSRLVKRFLYFHLF